MHKLIDLIYLAKKKIVKESEGERMCIDSQRQKGEKNLSINFKRYDKVKEKNDQKEKLSTHSKERVVGGRRIVCAPILRERKVEKKKHNYSSF
jgi:hypothetical protein